PVGHQDLQVRSCSCQRLERPRQRPRCVLHFTPPQCNASGPDCHGRSPFRRDAEVYAPQDLEAAPIPEDGQEPCEVSQIPSTHREGAWEQKAGSTEQKARKDRKSTRLKSSHVSISYAVFCLKKKNR